jgi:uncharacterized protein YrrD
MRFRHGAEIVSADQHSVGRIDRLVLDPDSKQITHLIARKGLLLTKDRLVPLSTIASHTADRVEMAINADEADGLPEFEERIYMPVKESDWPQTSDHVVAPGAQPPDFFLYGSTTPDHPTPIVVPGPVAAPDYLGETSRNIPENMVALKAGAAVLDSNGEKVGHVEQTLTEPNNEQITHFVISKGLLVKERKMVSTKWVQLINDEEVHLSVPASRLEKFPDYESPVR